MGGAQLGQGWSGDVRRLISGWLGRGRRTLAWQAFLCALAWCGAWGASAHAQGAAACTAGGGAPGNARGPGSLASMLGAMSFGASSGPSLLSSTGLAGVLSGAGVMASSANCIPVENASLPGAGVSRAAGNPVDVVTGHKYERAIDLHLPSPSPATGDLLEFVFSRHYHGATAGESVLGPGWRHGLETRLFSLRRKRVVDIQLHQPDGRVITFTRARRLADGVLRRQPELRGDGVLDEQPGGARGGWVWRWRNGRQLVFDAQGRLGRIVAPDRDAIALRHDSQGRLTGISDNRGHRLELQYHETLAQAQASPQAAPGAYPGRLAALLLPTGKRIGYRYDAQGRLAVVDHAQGSRITYRYADPVGPNRLTGIVLPDGRASEYRYDDSGRVVYSRGVDDDDAHALRFEYTADDPATKTGHTTIRQADAVVADYRWHQDPLAGPLIDAGEGAGCDTCPPTGLRYRYDTTGEVASVAGREMRLDLVRDTQGRLVAVRERQGESDSPDANGHGPQAVIAGGGLRGLDDNAAPGGRKSGAARRAADAQGDAGMAAVARTSSTGASPGTNVPAGSSPSSGMLVWPGAAAPGSATQPAPRERPGRRARQQVIGIRWADNPVLDLAVQVRLPSIAPGRWHEWRLQYSPSGLPIDIAQAGFAPPAGAQPPRAIERRVRLHYADHGPGLGKLVAIDGPLPWPTGAVRLHYDEQRRVVRTEPAQPPVADEADAMASIGSALAMARRAGLDARWDDIALGTLALSVPGAPPWSLRADDFGRVAVIAHRDAGTVVRVHDETDRIVSESLPGMATASYRRDERGRVVEHTVSGPGAAPVTTRFRYERDHLAEVVHPEQSESYEYDDAGRRVTRRVRLHTDVGPAQEFVTRYVYEGLSRRPARWTLPDGTWLRAGVDDAGQQVSLTRRVGLRDQPLAGGLLRDRHGLVRLVYGNGLVAATRRDSAGLASVISRVGRSAAGDAPAFGYRVNLDANGHVVRRSGVAGDEHFAYDGAARLILAHRAGPLGAQLWRYHYDAHGNRVLAQQGVPPAAAATAPTERAGASLRTDLAGRVLDDGLRTFVWTPAGQLAEVRTHDGRVVRMRYNHHGQRVSKEADGRITRYLYDDDRRLLAQVDDGGQVLRQYVSLGGQPLAVIEPPAAGAPRERTVFLHLNHLGAPELATDDEARVVWRATYAPFGRATVTAAPQVRHAGAGVLSPAPFTLDLRLPGQFEDPQTGLHYNDHRYYDPDAGRYLSPDPLLLRGGANLYAYAGQNPLGQIDPSGLLLFAFDGTGNGDPPQRRDDWSNVYKLARAYADGRVWYMSGVGTTDPASGISGGYVDSLDAASARDRVYYLLGELERAVSGPVGKTRAFDIDIIGFSRGAAMARDFSSRVAQRARDGDYARLGACVHLRFLGLWDTVAQFGFGGMANIAWRLSVPSEMGYTAQAVALNEHRLLFPAESIMGATGGGVRIEQGFVGAHSDIGGGYAEGDLSDVTLVWMRQQALLAGVPMFALTSEFARVSSPLLHDSNTSGAGDREFLQRNAIGWVTSSQSQRMARVDGMQWSDTAAFIQRYATPQADAYGALNIAGTIDMSAYGQWLRSNYAITVGGP